MTTKQMLCQQASGLTGTQTWCIAIGLAVALFMAARAVDTYRHRLARDRQLAIEYRAAMVGRRDYA
jgi:hypothetical protein